MTSTDEGKGVVIGHRCGGRGGNRRGRDVRRCRCRQLAAAPTEFATAPATPPPVGEAPPCANLTPAPAGG